MNKILTTVAVLFTAFVMAQDTETKEEVAKEETTKKTVVGRFAKNRFTVAATLGYNTYTTQQALGASNSYTAQKAYKNWVDTGIFFGVEGGWFFSNTYKATLEVGYNHSYSPGYQSVPGTGDVEDGGVPSYGEVPSTTTTTYRVFAGVNKYNTIKRTPKVAFFYGAGAGVSHGISDLKEDTVASQGTSYGESFSVTLAANAGLEYSFTPELFLQIQASPFATTYNVTSIKPVPGVAALKSDTYDINFLSSPMFKLGFNF